MIIFSNATKKRIKPFKDKLNVDALARAGKPNKRNFLKIIKLFKYDLSEVVIIGDQLYKDILGGNKVGITTILINPVSKKDPLWVKPGRFYEKRIMKRLKDHDLFFKGRYYE